MKRNVDFNLGITVEQVGVLDVVLSEYFEKSIISKIKIL